jgi:hypothetical protein
VFWRKKYRPIYNHSSINDIKTILDNRFFYSRNFAGMSGILSFLNKACIAGFFLLMLLPGKLNATIFPQSGASLNFTQVLFVYEESESADGYQLVIQPENKPEKEITLRFKNKSLAYLVTNGLHFGSDYTWFWEAYRNNKKIFTSPLYRFSIVASNLSDKNQVGIRVTRNNQKQNQDNIFLLDYLGVAINRKGEVIWYMPRTEEKKKNGDSTRRSLRITETGNFTYLDNTNCYEKDIFGNIIWMAPNDGKVSGEQTEFYHHDFRKLTDQTYVCCSYRFEREPNYFDLSKTWKVRYNTVIQYNTAKEVIWYWNEKDHVDGSLIFESGDSTVTDFPGTHMNGFDYDLRQDAFIFSFRNSSRILKVNHKTKEVAFELGRYEQNKNAPKEGSYRFSNQHGPAWMPDGSILVYENNMNEKADKTMVHFPHLLIIRQPEKGGPEKKVWDYECKSDSFPNGQKGKEGIAFPMYNGHINVSQGSSNRIFELTLTKEIVWEAFCFEKKPLGGFEDPGNGQWVPFTNYRTYAVSSLFPTFFTLQKASGINNNKTNPGYYINNEGTDDKIFVIESHPDDSKKTSRVQQVLIRARNRFLFAGTEKNIGFYSIYPLYSKELAKTIPY